MLAYGSPICANIKTVFKAGKKAWTGDLELCNYVVLDSLFNNLTAKRLLFSALNLVRM